MKKVCMLCEQTAPDNNLFCQEIYCQAEQSPTILDYGEWLGHIEIVKPLSILRSSVLYEARFQKTPILLKVAHPGSEHTARIKREAEFLQDMTLAARAAKKPLKYLPVWLPPTIQGSEQDTPYGKMVLQDQLLYFLVCEYVAGEPLRYLLNKQPQLWSKHVGGIISSLATAVASLQNHKQRLLHGSISPDAVLIHFDAKTYEPHIVLCDLGIASPFRDFSAQWYPAVAHPTYTAPELVDTHIPPQPNHYFAIDVYGLGLVLYELLVGKPAFPFTLASDHDIYQAIRSNHRIMMTRQSDEQALARIAIDAINQNPGNRIPNVTDMLKNLKQEGFKSVEPAPRDRWATARKIGIIVVIVLAVVMLLILSFVISEQLAG